MFVEVDFSTIFYTLIWDIFDPFHLLQFCTPALLGQEWDKNDRLRRLRYNILRIDLGHIFIESTLTEYIEIMNRRK